MRRLLAAAVLVLAAEGQSVADFQTGVAAIQQQQFEDARVQFRAAHEAGDPRGAFMLGVMQENGWGAPADMDAAVMWYARAAERGLASAQFNLGIIYVHGRGAPQDFAKAFGYFTSAADQGHAGAMNNLGSMLDNGNGVRRDRVEALKWFTLAAERLKDDDLMVAQSNILRVEENLTPAQIAEAGARVAAWKAAHPDLAQP